MYSKFRNDHSFSKRLAEAERIRQKYPNRIPVVCEKAHNSTATVIQKTKYLVPADLTVGQFIYVIRKAITLSPDKALFVFVEDVLPPTGDAISTVYEQHKDEDGFLYMTYSDESVFGNL